LAKRRPRSTAGRFRQRREIAAAASLLGAAKSRVIAGLRTDAAGASEGVVPARRLDAALDHAESAAILRDSDAVRAEADVVLVVGDPGEDDRVMLVLDQPPAEALRGARYGAVAWWAASRPRIAGAGQPGARREMHQSGRGRGVPRQGACVRPQ